MTMGRILLAFLFPVIPVPYRLLLVFIAMATEYLDGELARKFGWQTELGRILDPIADKIFFACVAGTLVLEGQLQWWQLIAIGSRDLMVFFGTLLVSVRGNARQLSQMTPDRMGKLTTALQYIAFFILLTGRPLGTLFTLIICLVGLTAALHYKNQYSQELKKNHKWMPSSNRNVMERL